MNYCNGALQNLSNGQLLAMACSFLNNHLYPLGTSETASSQRDIIVSFFMFFRIFYLLS